MKTKFLILAFFLIAGLTAAAEDDAFLVIVNDAGALETCRASPTALDCSTGIGDLKQLLEAKFNSLFGKTGCGPISGGSTTRQCGTGDESDFPESVCDANTCTKLEVVYPDTCDAAGSDSVYKFKFTCNNETTTEVPEVTTSNSEHLPSGMTHHVRPSDAITWDSALNICKADGQKRLCFSHEICNLKTNVKYTPDIPEDDKWVPVRDTENEWIQIGDARMCKKHIVLYGEPGWGRKGGNCPASTNCRFKEHIYCCEQVTQNKPLGCWTDTENDRAMTMLTSYFVGSYDVSYSTRNQPKQKCASLAHSLGYSVWALQDGGQCFGSATQATYKKHGSAEGCDSNGTGGAWKNSVYLIKGDELITTPSTNLNDATHSMNDSAVGPSMVTDHPGQRCPNHYEYKGGLCVDIDECDAAVNPCDFGWCINQEGSYSCNCSVGFHWNNSTKVCESYNYCVDGICSNGKCTSNQGWYLCSCAKGYSYNRKTDTCEDFDECATGRHFCHRNAKCTNVEGGYQCRCQDNFEGNGINRCEISVDIRHHMNLTCESTAIKVSVEQWLIDTYGKMHMSDHSCDGIKRPSGWLYAIRRDLSSCGTVITENSTHIIYSNTLNNEMDDATLMAMDSDVDMTNQMSITFSCAYPSKKLFGKLEKGSEAAIGTGEIVIGFPDKEGKYPVTTILPPYLPKGTDKEGLGGYDPDEKDEFFKDKRPTGYNPDENVIGVGGKTEPGNPHLETETLSNGTKVTPGKDSPLPKEVKDRITATGEPGGFDVVTDGPIKMEGPNLTGNYNVSMIPFTNSEYKNVQMKTYFYTQEPLYIRILVMTQDKNILLYAEKCWATRDKDRNSEPRIELVNSGCANPTALEGKVTLNFNGETRHSDLNFPVFMFPGKNSLYLHCLVDLCNKRSTNSHLCDANCDGNRKRRSALMETVQISPDSYQHRTNVSMLIFIKESNQTNEDLWGPNQRGEGTQMDNYFIPMVVAIVLCSVLFILCCCCFLVVLGKRRRRKKEDSLDDET